MFCPVIKRECVREKCRDWDIEAGDCQVRSDRKLARQMVEQQSRLIEIEKLNAVWFKLNVSNLLSDPGIPDEAKETIRQALQAQDADVAEKLLRDAGLIRNG